MRVLALAAVVACGDNTPERVLVYTRTLGHRHEEAIAESLRVLPDRLAADHVVMDHTEDPAAFTPQQLARYGAVMFLYTSGDDILDADGKVALEAFVRGGGGFVGIHSASDTESAWPFYRDMLLAHYAGHPVVQPAVLHVEAPDHPVMRGVPEPWLVEYDEWYNFDANPRDTPGVEVLVTIDESTYTGGTMGADHPMVWCHARLGGRVFYTQPFHEYWRWDDATYLDYIARATEWVLPLGG